MKRLVAAGVSAAAVLAGGMLTSLAMADDDSAQDNTARTSVALEGGDLVDVGASNSALVLGGKALGGTVADPATTLFTVTKDNVGQSISLNLDATSIAANLPKGTTAGDVTLSLTKAVTPADGGVQARDDAGTVVLGDAEADLKSVVIPANGKRTDSWVFNAQGRFTLTFQASVPVTANGQTTTWKSAETTYLVQAGDPIKLEVSLAAEKAQVDSGADVKLTATLDPQDAAGTVSFKDGDTMLGSVAVAADSGQAAYTAKGLKDGKHEITASFTPSDDTQYAMSASVPVTVRVGDVKATVLDSGSLQITPKLSTDQDTSACAETQTCKPTTLTAGLVDRTDVDASTAAQKDRPWDSQQWYAADDVIIHLRQGPDGYTTPTTVNAKGADINRVSNPTKNSIKGTNPQQSVAEYLNDQSSNHLLLGQSFSINYLGGIEGINSSAFEGSYRSHVLRLRDLTSAPESGVMKVSASNTMKNNTDNSVDWNSSEPAEERKDWALAGSDPTGMAIAEWSFSQPGVYCVPIQMVETLRDDSGDSAKDTKISATGTYTFVVGDTVDPSTVTPCDQVADNGTGDQPVKVDTNVLTDGGHHDIRIYQPEGSEKFTFGLDTSGEKDSKYALNNLVWANAAGPKTVAEPTSDTDMTAVGPVGTKYWYFPSSSNDSDPHPWPGFSAESLTPDDYASPITWRFTGFSRDGQANPSDTNVVMMGDTFTSSRVMSLWNTRLGFPTAFEAAPKTHFHPVWAFTQPGVYCVAMEATGKTSSGSWVSGDGQITMVVGTHADDANIPEDLSTVTPCEKNGKAAPVAQAKSLLGVTTANEVYKPQPAQKIADVVELGWNKSGGLEQVASTAKSVNDEAVRRDPNDVVLTAPTFEPRSQAWVFGGSQGTNKFAFDTTSMLPSSLKDGTVNVSLGTPDGPDGGVVHAINTSNWPNALNLSTDAGGQRSFDMVAQTTTNASGAGFWWTFTKPGVYCVPVTVSATKADGSPQSSSKTYTFIAGNTSDPDGADYVDPATVTTCSRGQKGAEASQPGDNKDPSEVTHDDIYVPNGSYTDSGAVILNEGHIDIASTVSGSTLETWIKDTTTDEERWHALTGSHALKDTAQAGRTEANGAVLQVFPDAKVSVPSGDQWSFLGSAGDSIYELPQVQDPELLWAGWSTQSIAEAATKTGFDWTLDRISMADGSAPKGAFSVFETDTFGSPTVLFHADGAQIDKPTYTIPKNAHVHANWSFGQEGTYCLAFTRSTTLASGQQVSDSFTIPVAVGAVDMKKVDPAQCFSGTTVDTLDTSALQAAIDAADKLVEADYTADSWKPFAEALSNAKAVLAKAEAQSLFAAGSSEAASLLSETTGLVELTSLLSDATVTQADVDAATEALTAAQAALVEAESEPEPTVDTSKLQDAVDAADKLVKSDYTADSWKVFAEALANAKAVFADTAGTQDAVDAATEALTDAQAALVKAASTRSDGQQDNTVTPVDDSKDVVDSDNSADNGSSLAQTGSNASILLAAMVVLTIAGTGVTLLARRRRE